MRHSADIDGDALDGASECECTGVRVADISVDLAIGLHTACYCYYSPGNPTAPCLVNRSTLI